MNVTLRASVLLRLILTGVLALVAGFVLATAFGLYRSPLMIHWLDAPALC